MTEELFQEESGLDKDKLEKLSELCRTQKYLQEKIEQGEEQLKRTKEELRAVSQGLIPALLNEVGISEVRLSSGEKVIVEDKLKASIPDKNFVLAFRNMVLAEGGDDIAEEKVSGLFSSKLLIDEISDRVMDILMDHDVEFEMKRDIHWQTLAKYCRQRLEQGLDIPEGISVYQYQETKIK